MITPRKPRPCPGCTYDVSACPWEPHGVLCPECGKFSEWHEFTFADPARTKKQALVWSSGLYAALCAAWFVVTWFVKFVPAVTPAAYALCALAIGPALLWWFVGPPVMMDWAALRVPPPYRTGMYLLIPVGWVVNVACGVALIIGLRYL